MRIRDKLLFSTLVPVIAVFVAGISFSYVTSGKALEEQIAARAENMVKAYTWRLDGEISSLTVIAKGLAASVEAMRPTSVEQVNALIEKTLQSYPAAFGSTIAFAPDSFSKEQRLVAPYLYRGKEGLEFKDLSDESYNYPKWEWFTIPEESGKPRWSEPYIDVGGGDLPMTTYSQPFFRDGRFWGVATIDVALEELTDEIEKIKVATSGRAFLISKEGRFLTVPDEDWNLKRTILDAAKELASDDFARLGKKMMAGESGYIPMVNPLTKQPVWIAYGPIRETGWSLGIEFPERELLAEIVRLHRNILFIAIAGIIAVTTLILLVSSRIARPVKRLAESSRRIADGDLSVPPPGADADDELGVLARAFRDMEGSLSGMLSKLKQERWMFEACFSQMSDGIVIFDPNWKVLQFNRAAENLLALPSPGPFWEHVQAHFDASVPIEKVTDISSIEHAAFELNRRESDHAGELYLIAILIPIQDEEGRTAQIAMSLRDITEDRAEEGSKRDFLALISHKLNTPVTVLKSNISLMKDGLLGEMSDKQKRQMEAMSKQVAKLAAVIEELVGFVTIENENLSAAKEEIDLPAFLGEIAASVKDSYSEKEPEVRISVDAGASPIPFNRQYMELISRQLMDNGLKFNMSKPAIAEVRCARVGDRIVMEFSDNGIGIPPEYRDRIFDKFFQIEKYFTGNVEGIGLGLSYVKKIVDHFGGSIEVRSTPGQGSSFIVRLPIA